MTANTPYGYNYELLAITPAELPATPETVAFVKKEDDGITLDTQDGTNSIEVLDMLIHRFNWLAENNPDGTDQCICDYVTAAKAINLARSIVINYEDQLT